MMEWCGFVRKDHNSKKNLKVKVLDFVQSGGAGATAMRRFVLARILEATGTTSIQGALASLSRCD